MARILPLLALVVGLALGVVLGLAISAPEPAPPPKAQHRPAEPIGHAASPSAPDPGPAPEPEPEPEPEPTELPVPLQGDGVMEGVITLADGNPLADVPVAVSAMLARAEPGDAARPRQALLTVTTDAAGRYRVQGLDPQGFYAVRPGLAGFSFRSDRPEGVRYFRCGTVNFTASIAVRVVLALTVADGTQPSSAEVAFGREGDHRRQVWHWTAAEPARDFQPGVWLLTVSRAAGREFRGQARVSVAVGKGPVHVQMRLEPMAAVRGLIGAPPGMPDCEVLLAPRGSGAHARRLTVSAAGGWRFEFKEITAGEYDLRVLLDTVPVATQALTVADRDVVAHLEIPPPEAKDHIVVRVHGPGGPIDGGVTFRVAHCALGSSFGETQNALRRGQGEYWLRRNRAYLPSADDYYEITVTMPGMGSLKFKYMRDATHELEARFDKPVYLTVEVEGLDGHPDRDAMVVKLYRRNFNGQHVPDWSRESLEAIPRFGPLTPGEYTVTLELARERTGQTVTLASQKVKLEATDQTVRLSAPVVYTLTVAVPEHLRERELILMQIAGVGIQASRQVGPDGQVEFRKLREGEYLLQMASIGVMKVSIPGDHLRPVDFAPRPFNALRIRRYEPGVDIGIKPGDHVVEIDGEAMDDDPPRQKLVAEAALKESTTWIVVRNGTRVSVTFDGRDWARAGLTGESARVD